MLAMKEIHKFLTKSRYKVVNKAIIEIRKSAAIASETLYET